MKRCYVINVVLGSIFKEEELILLYIIKRAVLICCTLVVRMRLEQIAYGRKL